MNKTTLYSTIIVFILCTIQIQARDLYLDVEIKNPTTQEISFSYPENKLLGEEKIFKANIDASGIVTTMIQVAQHPFVTVHYDKTSFLVFVEGFEMIALGFDANDISNTLSFSGDGGLENELLNKNQTITKEQKSFNRGFISAHLDKDILEMAQNSATLNDFKKALPNPTFLKNEKANTKVVKFINQRTEFEYYTQQLAFFLANQNKWSTTEIQKMAKENHFMEGVVIENDELLKHDFYINFIQAYTYHLYVTGYSTETDKNLIMYDIASKAFTGETRDWLLCKILLNAKAEQNTTLASRKFFALKRSSNYQRYIKAVEQAYGDNLSFDPDGAAPDFELKDDNGNTVKLSDYKGKVVYISFWATWCRPCLANFTKTEGIRKQMLDQGVVLLNVCLDNTEDKWRRTMMRVPMPGINLYASANTPLKLKYDLSRLPAYFIVNKQGDFTYLPDGTRDVLDEFKKLVEQ